MSKLLSFATGLVLVFASAACSTTPVMPPPEPPKIVVSPAPNRTEVSESQTVKDKIYRQYQQWKGTRYQYGGLSKAGIDCSGFVYLTYREQLGIEIPRSTKYQCQVGKEIDRSELRPGDLVFFRISSKGRHVGIYLEDDKFLHASTKRGVIISSLDDTYWKDAYWHSRRVDF